MLELTTALEEFNAPRLREAAHKYCGLLSAFSSTAGNMAAQLEDVAAASQFHQATPLVGWLTVATEELIGKMSDLTVEGLQRQLDVFNASAFAGIQSG
jgi:hypothetical protein